jgi:hypothetical protein
MKDIGGIEMPDYIARFAQENSPRPATETPGVRSADKAAVDGERPVETGKK